MKYRFILTLGIFLTGLRVTAQPLETNYIGNVVISGYDDDSSHGPFNIGFTFNYYGNDYTQFYINSNGMILFGSGSPESTVTMIPDTTKPNNYIAPFWDDLVVDPSGKILYTTFGAAPNRKMVVQFTNMGFYTHPVILGTFQVILYETSNKIQIQYRLLADNNSTRTHGGTATIGLEDQTGTGGTLYSFQSPTAISTEQAISFTPPGPIYTINDNAVYDGIYLTTNLSLPEPGITTLISPPENAVIGTGHTFEWSAASYATSYKLYISTSSDLSGSTSYNPGTNLTYNVTGLTPGMTYYWGVFATNATGTTWCEIKKFTVSSDPPLAPVSQVIWTEQGTDKTIKLNYTGGGASAKTAIVTILPASGELYQYNAGVRGSLINSAQTTVTDPGRNIIYAANGISGNGVGNFNFKIHDASGDSPAGLITTNVSPPGVPNVLSFARDNNVHIQFDIPMADPTGKELQFEAKVNGTPSTISSLGLKPNDPYTIVLTLASPLTGSETVLVSYLQGDVTSITGGLLFSFTDQPVELLAQNIAFTTNLTKTFGDAPFSLSASSTGGGSISFSSSNLSVATISGNLLSMLSAGTSDITAYQAGNSTYAPARNIRVLTVNPGPGTKTLNLKLFPEGLYNGAGGLVKVQGCTDGENSFDMFTGTITDTLTVQLAQVADPYLKVYTAHGVPINTDGTISLSDLPGALSGSYYIIIKHRNHIETWSQIVSFTDPVISYNFTNAISKAWGDNLKLIGSVYCIFTGDANKDQYVDGFDLAIVFNLSKRGRFGYQVADMNGDGFIDGFDLAKVYNNSKKGVGMNTPAAPLE
jgi:hypothetical protein